MDAFLEPPQRIPFYLRIGIWISRKITGKEMLPAKLLAWYPRAAIGSGVLEALAAHPEADLDERMLKLVRIQASFAAACPFCIDMNSFRYEDCRIGKVEIEALQGLRDVEQMGSFSEREKLALQYTKLITQTPLQFPAAFITRVKEHFDERESVILASTAAQVNFWARLIQALGVPPAGFSNQCEIPNPIRQ